MGAMGPPGGGRNPISSRLLRHFNLVCMTEFDEETMVKIFGSVMSFSMRKSGFAMPLQEVGQSIVLATMHIYKEAIATLLPTPAKSHYIFNLRDFARIVNGTLLVNKKSIDDKPLSDHLIRLRTGFKVISPDKKIHLVPRRKLPSFCEKHGLQIDSIYKMKQGVTRTHKGWTVA